MIPRTVVLCLLTTFGVPTFADRETGREVFYSAGCIACHAIECNRTAPKLGGIIGRRAGSVSDYADYSDAMKASKIVWTEETLDTYLADPSAMVPGNGMAAVGKFEDEEQRRHLIDFLKEPDNKYDLCF